MAKKEFSFQGRSIEDLKKLSIKEFAQLIPSRQRRSLLGGWTDQQKILIKNLEKNNTVETHLRDTVIIPQWVGKTIKVHRGNEFVSVIIEPEMVGHMLGEFAMSRRKVEHHAPGIGATKSSGGIAAR
jgi:small subunit ribosomal protein S19